MSTTPKGFEVRYESNAYVLSLDPDKGDFEVLTDLSVDLASSHLKFEVVPLLRTGLHENSIREVFLQSEGDDTRIGWIIPANALSSSEHDYSENVHFLKYAYVTMLEVLEKHQGLYEHEVERHQSQGVSSVPFGNLFPDTVCFLAISVMRLPEDAQLDGLIPSLIGQGYVPHGACSPDSVYWRPSTALVEKKVRLRLIGPSIDRPEVPIKMMTIAAAANTSPVTQFFYLYQVVEFMMELVLRRSIASIGSDIGKSLQEENYQLLREHLDNLQKSMAESRRLTILMDCCVDSGKAISELESSATDFLQTVGMKQKPGILSLYQVRNFIVHQVRSMPEEAEELLESVVHELAQFLSIVLATFDGEGYTPSLASSPGAKV